MKKSNNSDYDVKENWVKMRKGMTRKQRTLAVFGFSKTIIYIGNVLESLYIFFVTKNHDNQEFRMSICLKCLYKITFLPDLSFMFLTYMFFIKKNVEKKKAKILEM